MISAVLPQINRNGNHKHEHKPNRFAVIPTPEKLNASPHFTGRGVCIAFLDSGFYPHPDLRDRIIAFHDVSGEESELTTTPQPHHWHGTQTTVSCAGDGSLSEGIYRGIASESQLVLVKVSENGRRISEENIERGLEWILENRERYNIRILNLSLGGDDDVSCERSRIDQLAEECVRQGIVVIVAAGNSATRRPIPPANAPAVITVGGYSDENQIDFAGFALYGSSFGTADDGTVKPEIIAPAMYIAAPILPHTPNYQAAEMLSWLANAPDYKLFKLVFEHWHQAGLPERVLFQDDIAVVREFIESEIRSRKIVATHYQHVDGTSFAAPIVASVVAQMLEANPDLTPAAIKNILISTAERLTNFPLIRQGYGCIHARRAVEEAQKEMHLLTHLDYTPPRVENGKILFSFHDDTAKTIYLAGDFNDWTAGKDVFIKQPNGIWQAEINCLSAGKYRYKFVVDEKHWTDDASNSMKEPDGFGGFNSILHIR